MGDREEAYREIFKNSLHLSEYNKAGKLRMNKDLMNLSREHFKHTPNQRWHRIISFLKSAVRLIGYTFIPFNLVVATLILIISEIIRMIEELV
jgi:hypothetical protein